MAKKQSKKQAEGTAVQQANAFDVALVFVSSGFRLLHASIWPLTLCVFFVCGYLSIDSLAGKKTDANILATITANWGLDRIFTVLAGGGGVGYGLYERRLRMKSVAALREQNEKLEADIDPGRTSSGLLPGGDMPKLS